MTQNFPNCQTRILIKSIQCFVQEKGHFCFFYHQNENGIKYATFPLLSLQSSPTTGIIFQYCLATEQHKLLCFFIPIFLCSQWEVSRSDMSYFQAWSQVTLREPSILSSHTSMTQKSTYSRWSCNKIEVAWISKSSLEENHSIDIGLLYEQEMNLHCIKSPVLINQLLYQPRG